MVLPGGYVLTNAHVVFTKETATRVQAADSLIGVTADKRRFAFDIVYADVRRDMALIVSDDLAAPAVTFADGDVTIGEKVYAIGNSKGQGREGMRNDETDESYRFCTACGIYQSPPQG